MNNNRNWRSSRGQAMVEYLVGMLVVMMIVGVAFAGDVSVIDTFLAAVRTAFNKLSSFLSLPI